MQGVVVVPDGIGRVLRTRCLTLRSSDLLGCSGDFTAGDRVYVVMRTRDGSQFVVATGTASLDAAACDPAKDRALRQDDHAGGEDENAVVIREQDMALQWPAHS